MAPIRMAAIENRSATMSPGLRSRSEVRSRGKVVPQMMVMRRSDASARRLRGGRADSAARPARGPGVQRLDGEGEAFQLHGQVHVPEGHLGRHEELAMG